MTFTYGVYEKWYVNFPAPGETFIDNTDVFVTSSSFSIKKPATGIRAEDYITRINYETEVHDWVYEKNYVNTYCICSSSNEVVAVFEAQSTNVVANGNTWAKLPTSNSTSIQTSKIFNENNPYEKAIELYGRFPNGTISVYAPDSASWYQAGDPTETQKNQNLFTFNVIFNIPPNVDIGSPSYEIPIAGVGSYVLPLTSLIAQYGGIITEVKLTIGSDSITNTYSSTTITNETISIIPTSSGVQTPILEVKDSRDQIKTISLSPITVNPYNGPNIGFDLFRSNSVGIKDDEGEYGLITSEINFLDTVSSIEQPIITIDGNITNNVVWYSNYNSSSGVSDLISDWSTVYSGDTIYGVINGSFIVDQSYTITMVVFDSSGVSSLPITQTLSTAFYTIDFQAGGKEIAFGAPANDNLSQHPNGLFKCAMDAQFEGGVSGAAFLNMFYPVGSYYETSDTTFDPNDTWGGTWVLENPGLVHVSSGTGYAVGVTGGSETHVHTTGDCTLNANQIPYHTHTMYYDYWTVSTGSGTQRQCLNINAGAASYSKTTNAQSGSYGSAHNHGNTGSTSNMQPYIVVNRWHRTA